MKKHRIAAYILMTAMVAFCLAVEGVKKKFLPVQT